VVLEIACKCDTVSKEIPPTMALCTAHRGLRGLAFMSLNVEELAACTAGQRMWA